MEISFLLTVGIMFLGVILAALVLARALLADKESLPDYYSLLVIGIVWFAVGLPLNNFGLSGMGAIFVVVSLANRDRWGEGQKSWGLMDTKEKSLRFFALVFLCALVFAGGAILYAVSQGIIK